MLCVPGRPTVLKFATNQALLPCCVAKGTFFCTDFIIVFNLRSGTAFFFSSSLYQILNLFFPVYVRKIFLVLATVSYTSDELS